MASSSIRLRGRWFQSLARLRCLWLVPAWLNRRQAALPEKWRELGPGLPLHATCIRIPFHSPSGTRLRLACCYSRPALHKASFHRTPGMDALNAQEQRELQSRMEKKQMKEFMNVYSNLVQNCFNSCINSFETKSLTSREENCVMRCVDKHLKSQGRLGERFQEQNAAMSQAGGLPGR